MGLSTLAIDQTRDHRTAPSGDTLFWNKNLFIPEESVHLQSSRHTLIWMEAGSAMMWQIKDNASQHLPFLKCHLGFIPFNSTSQYINRSGIACLAKSNETLAIGGPQDISLV